MASDLSVPVEDNSDPHYCVRWQYGTVPPKAGTEMIRDREIHRQPIVKPPQYTLTHTPTPGLHTMGIYIAEIHGGFILMEGLPVAEQVGSTSNFQRSPRPNASGSGVGGKAHINLID